MSSHGIDHGMSQFVRGALLAISSAVLAISAHTLAGGDAPDMAMTLLLAILIGWTSTEFAAKAGGVLRTLAVLGTGQLVMHLVLSTLRVHDAGHHGAGVVNGWVMTATHIAAAMVTALLLARAESALCSVIGAIRSLRPAVWRPAPVPAAVAAPTLIPAADTSHLVSVVSRHVNGQRGPPMPV